MSTHVKHKVLQVTVLILSTRVLLFTISIGGTRFRKSLVGLKIIVYLKHNAVFTLQSKQLIISF